MLPNAKTRHSECRVRLSCALEIRPINTWRKTHESWAYDFLLNSRPGNWKARLLLTEPRHVNDGIATIVLYGHAVTTLLAFTSGGRYQYSKHFCNSEQPMGRTLCNNLNKCALHVQKLAGWFRNFLSLSCARSECNTVQTITLKSSTTSLTWYCLRFSMYDSTVVGSQQLPQKE